MPAARLSVEVEGKIDDLQSKMIAAKASVKSFTGYTDAELLKTSQHFQGLGGVNQVMAEKVAAGAKAARLAADAQKALAVEAATSTSGLAGVGVAATKALSALRVMAYVLPGIGIAGIFNLAYEAIGPLISKLDLFNSKLGDLKGSAAVLGAAFDSSDYKKAVSNITELTENFKLAREGVISKEEVLKQYNETLGKTTGYTDDFNIAEKLTVDQAPAFIKMTLLKAAAQLALEQSTAKTLEAALKTNRQANSFKTTGETLGIPDFDASKAATEAIKKGAKTREDVLIAINKARETAFANTGREQQIREIAQAEVSADNFLKIFKDFQEKAAQIAKENGLNFLPDKDAPDKAKDPKRETALPWIGNYKAALARFSHQVTVDTQKALGEVAANIESQPPVIGEAIVSTMATPFEIFKDDVVYDLLPKLKGAFDNFFTNILETGKFSFAALGQAIIKSFASVLASDATTTLLGMLGNKDAKGKDTIFKSIAGLFGGGATAATGGGFLATALPIAGIALGALAIGSQLFKKRDRAPDPVYATNGVSTPSMGSQGNSVIQVIMTARGRDLVGTLNLEGFYLSRVQNGRG